MPYLALAAGGLWLMLLSSLALWSLTSSGAAPQTPLPRVIEPRHPVPVFGPFWELPGVPQMRGDPALDGISAPLPVLHSARRAIPVLDTVNDRRCNVRSAPMRDGLALFMA